MADGPRIAVGAAKVALIDGDNASGMIFTSLISRRSKTRCLRLVPSFFLLPVLSANLQFLSV